MTTPFDKASQPKPTRRRKKPGCLRQGCSVGCVGLLLLLIAALLFDPTDDITATPYGYEWEQRTEIEHQELVTESAWEDEVPAEAQQLSSTRELFGEDRVRTGTRTETRTIMERRRIGTERVKVETKELGDGSVEDVFESRPIYENVERTREIEVPVFEVQPVYKNKVSYTIQRWKPHRTHRAFGTGRPEVWPEADLNEGEREKNQERDFVVQLRDADGKIYQYRAADEAEWRKFRNSQSYRLETIGTRVHKVLW
ncbi:MAG: hypothetical protein AAGD01_17050 [Acidobacteriota bacterium]